MHQSQTENSAAYEKPVLEDLGSLAALTRGDEGNVTDTMIIGSQ